MLSPTRLAYAFRVGAPPALFAGAVAVALMFGATPFLIPEVAERYGISEGLAGTISVAQVGAFAVVNFVVPRLKAPSAAMLRLAVGALVVANVVSAISGAFPLLLAARMLAGGAAGTLTWIAWADAMRRPRSMASLAVAGPVTALVGAPILGVVSELGDQAVYSLLAASVIPALFLAAPAEAFAPRMEREVSASRSNKVLLVALMLLTLSGASLFVYEAVAARDIVGLSATWSSIGFSLNAAGGLVGARLASRHRRPGVWLATAAPAAWLTVGGGTPILFFIGMTWWGFAFWMGVPGVMQMLVERSLESSERAGDAQGFMAFGRAIGPGIGGAFVNADGLSQLAVTSSIGLAMSGFLVMGVQEGRERLPPTDPRTAVLP
ncbi:MAG TPA: MFS transporter [Acidimicrobiia bacterium]